jgi:hypothetical protein
MQELGIKTDSQQPKSIDQIPLQDIDLVVSFTDADKHANLPKRAKIERWAMSLTAQSQAGDTALSEVRRNRDEIDKRVWALFMDYWRRGLRYKLTLGERMNLYFSRHGTPSTWAIRGCRAIARFLTAKASSGCAKRLGLRALAVSFDAILTSPAVRARQTADLVASGLPSKPKYRRFRLSA